MTVQERDMAQRDILKAITFKHGDKWYVDTLALQYEWNRLFSLGEWNGGDTDVTKREDYNRTF